MITVYYQLNELERSVAGRFATSSFDQVLAHYKFKHPKAEFKANKAKTVLVVTVK